MRILVFLPLLGVAIVAGFALWALTSGRDPNDIPSALVGEPVPSFDLPAVEGTGTPGLASEDLSEGLAVVNVFASWCVPCRAEHPNVSLLAAEEGVALVALNYKDKPAEAARWLAELGNPYAAIGSDEPGRAGLDWGLTGVPETFVVRDGTVLHRHRGPLVGEDFAAFQEVLADARR